MRALCYHGKQDIRCDTVPDPAIEEPRDAIVKVTSCAICGSDLHLYEGLPGIKMGDIVGHEFMGEVVEVGRDNKKLKPGDRVVVPFIICCGECEQCGRGNWSVCERSNRNKAIADKVFGHTAAGMFGYTHFTGGYAGGQAEYVRVPYADVSPVKVGKGLTDEQVLFLGDILPTGWQAAKNCDIEPTDAVAVWGCGPVGQMCIRSALLLGARQVIAIDNVPERLHMAAAGGAVSLNFDRESVAERLNDLTGGKGPDKCIGAVGAVAHIDQTSGSASERAKPAALGSDHSNVLREMIYVCRPAGVLSVPGGHGGLLDRASFTNLMNKALTLRTGQTHVNRWTADLLHRIETGEIDPSFVITHRVRLEDGPAMYKAFHERSDGCIKVIMQV